MKAFVNKVGFPLISKPLEGFASNGVVFVRNWEELLPLFEERNNIFQEYLGDPDTLKNYFDNFTRSIPLFIQAPQIIIYSSATIISPHGEITPFLTLENYHQYGLTINCRRVDNPELEAIALRFAKAYFSEGGFGPMSIQFRQDIQGNWKAMEFNLRSNGNTFTRFLLGQDEIGIIINYALPFAGFPLYTPSTDAYSCRIIKTLQTHCLPMDNINILQRGKWESGR